MDEHLTRALYLGLALLLFAVAFTVFFDLYGNYEDFYTAVTNSANVDSLQTGKPSTGDLIVKGDSLVNLVLEKKRGDENIALQELYGETKAVDGPLPDMYVDGVNSSDCDPRSINAGDNYDAYFTFDSEGKPVRIDLYKR